VPVPVAADPVPAITFGIGGSDATYLGDGWSGAEPGYRWTLGRTSEIWLERPRHGGDCRLELDVSPFCLEPDVPRQRLLLRVREEVVGRAVVTTRRVLAFRIPQAVLAGAGPLKVQLECPDARAPADVGGSDRRVLALCCYGLALRSCPAGEQGAGLEAGGGLTIAAMERETGIAAADYMLGFESLGDNCEFGLVQRLCGAEPLSLLRFASISLPNLQRALGTRFDALGDPKNLTISIAGVIAREYMIRDHAYGLTYHTWKTAGSIDPQAFLAQQVGRLHMLRRKLIEDLTDARKVFVWKRNEPATEAEARALHAALRAYGPNTLLWVTASDPAVVPGVVEQIAPGLFHGTTDRFAPYNDANDLTLDLWLSLCVKADRMRAAAPVASGCESSAGSQRWNGGVDGQMGTRTADSRDEA
jgi:hypothetical protein